MNLRFLRRALEYFVSNEGSKMVFDFVKNLLTVVAVAAASVWLLKHGSLTSLEATGELVLGIAMQLVSGFLLLVLFGNLGSRTGTAGMSLWTVLPLLVYALVILEGVSIYTTSH